MNKPVTFTIPEHLNNLLHAKVGRGKMSSFVTKALWIALKKEEEDLSLLFLEADKDAANIEVMKDFADIDAKGFVGLDNYDENWE